MILDRDCRVADSPVQAEYEFLAAAEDVARVA
jgi:hypothetical protein